MVIGPDKGDLPVMRKLMQDTGCDMWFPFYPLCTEHCITDTYDMVYECYHRMIELYGGGNGCKCDYTICGDKDPYLNKHPEYRDEAGYRRNK